MADLAARSGLVFRADMTASPSMALAASIGDPDVGIVSITAQAYIGKPASALADITINIFGDGWANAPMPRDPAGPVLFDVLKLELSEKGSLALPMEFDGSPEGSGVAADGFSVKLGPVETEGSGAWSAGAIQLTDTLSVSVAVDRVNKVLGLLVPAQPPAFPNGSLVVSNTAGSSPKLASGVTDNAGDAHWSAGATVTRITATGVNSNTFSAVGPGDSGTLAVELNGATAASHALTGSGDNGTYSGLVISGQADYPPTTPGFWKSINVALSGLAVPIGISKLHISDTAAGATGEVYVVRDGVTANPAISSGSVSQAVQGTLAYSSSVPHYGSGAQLTCGLSISNLAGETYYGSADPLVIQGTNAITTAQTFTYANAGITTPIARQTTTAQAITPVTLNVDGSTHASGVIQATAKNVNGASAATSLASTVVLVKHGTASASEVDEGSVPVSGLGSSPNASNAARMTIGSGGDTPTGAASAWDPTAALATYEATVVGGLLAHDETNYASGHLPVGPNLSAGRTGAQYVTFAFDRTALSNFKINVTGSYAGCWIKLPGVSDDAAASPNAANGWWNAFQPYAGAGVPGNSTDPNAGCGFGTPMSGGSGAFQITFGADSSTNATGNQILVRFRLNSGQSISALGFSN